MNSTDVDHYEVIVLLESDKFLFRSLYVALMFWLFYNYNPAFFYSVLQNLHTFLQNQSTEFGCRGLGDILTRFSYNGHKTLCEILPTLSSWYNKKILTLTFNIREAKRKVSPCLVSYNTNSNISSKT